MRFQITTDYAMRILIYIYHHQSQLSQARYIAERIGISYAYAIKIFSRLKNAGIIESKLGQFGGYTLAKDPSDISLYDVIVIMEGEIVVNRCLHNNECCNYQLPGQCLLHQTFYQVQEDLISSLKNKKISDF